MRKPLITPMPSYVVRVDFIVDANTFAANPPTTQQEALDYVKEQLTENLNGVFESHEITITSVEQLA